MNKMKYKENRNADTKNKKQNYKFHYNTKFAAFTTTGFNSIKNINSKYLDPKLVLLPFKIAFSTKNLC